MQPRGTIGRNDKCYCGSGKKYKKCCLGNSKSNNGKVGDIFRVKGINAEKIVYNLAQKTFLSDWCYLNPKLPNGKELCDLLIVFSNIAIIIQVKDLKVGSGGKYKKSEVEKNLRQTTGAYRQLFELKSAMELTNPRRGNEKFNPAEIKEIFLISMFVGKDENSSSFFENIKGHNVHVFHPGFVEIIMRELDTISDFVEYLREKEVFLKDNKSMMIFGGEKELLAFYMMNQRSFKRILDANFITISEGSWDHYINLPEFKTKKKADEISYLWDSMIDRAHEHGSPEYEKIARELAKTNRFERRFLSKAFAEAHVKADKLKNANTYRRVISTKDTTYCFLFKDESSSRELRSAMLHAFCIVARNQRRENTKVVGIATEIKISPISSYDFLVFHKPEWTKGDEDFADQIQKESGILTKPRLTGVYEQEYPTNKIKSPT